SGVSARKSAARRGRRSPCQPGCLTSTKDFRRTRQRNSHLSLGRAFARWLPLDDSEAVAVEIERSARFCEARIPVLQGPDTLDDRQERPQAIFALQECKNPLDIVGPHLPSRK